MFLVTILFLVNLFRYDTNCNNHACITHDRITDEWFGTFKKLAENKKQLSVNEETQISKGQVNQDSISNVIIDNNIEKNVSDQDYEVLGYEAMGNE